METSRICCRVGPSVSFQYKNGLPDRVSLNTESLRILYTFSPLCLTRPIHCRPLHLTFFTLRICCTLQYRTVISTKFTKEKPRRLCLWESYLLAYFGAPADFLDPQYLLHFRAGLRDCGGAQRSVLGSGGRGPQAPNAAWLWTRHFFSLPTWRLHFTVLQRQEIATGVMRKSL